MKVLLDCPWCHEENELRKDRAGAGGSERGRVFCWSCAHRADVPRVQCDCRKCRVKQVPVESDAQKRKGRVAA